MFEELNQHRTAVAEQIQKACEIGFTGGELEKAHKVGDIHPNGKWVWTQLPSGRYDWRVIKKTGAGSGAAAPATAQKTAQSGKKEEEVKGFVNILKQKPNERHLELMDVDELKRFKDVANKCWLDDKNLNRSTRLQCREWRDLANKELASKDEETRARQQENEYRKQHPNSVTKNSDIQQQASKGKEEVKKKIGDEEKSSFKKKHSFDSVKQMTRSMDVYLQNKVDIQPFVKILGETVHDKGPGGSNYRCIRTGSGVYGDSSCKSIAYLQQDDSGDFLQFKKKPTEKQLDECSKLLKEKLWAEGYKVEPKFYVREYNPYYQAKGTYGIGISVTVNEKDFKASNKQ